MNIILFDTREYSNNGCLVLRDHRLTQIRDQLGCGVGDRVRVGQIDGPMGFGQIMALDEDGVELTLSLDAAPPPKLPLSLLLALPRPKMLRRILRSAAELGIRDLTLINSAKVEKSYWQSPVLQADSIRHYLLEGLQQARDTVLPSVTCHRLFKPFVEDQLPALCAGTTTLIAHPTAATACPVALTQPVTLAIGPEGGFTDYEVEKFREAGFTPVHLGDRILRVETAVTALTSRLFCP